MRLPAQPPARRRLWRFVAVLVAIAISARVPVLAVLAIVALGVSSQILGLSLQTRLMDVSPAAPSLGAALCHSALNLGNASGAWLGGVVIATGYGFVAPAWVGAGLTGAGLVVVLAVGRAPAPRWPAHGSGGALDELRADERVGASPSPHPVAP